MWTTTIRIPLSIFEEVSKLALEADRSRNKMIGLLLQDALNNRHKGSA